MRKYELDWLRVIVTINLIPFHVAWMMTSVNGFSFVEKGTVAWNILHGFVQFISPLHMYLLLLVAGTSTFLSLHSSGRVMLIDPSMSRIPPHSSRTLSRPSLELFPPASTIPVSFIAAYFLAGGKGPIIFSSM